MGSYQLRLNVGDNHLQVGHENLVDMFARRRINRPILVSDHFLYTSLTLSSAYHFEVISQLVNVVTLTTFGPSEDCMSVTVRDGPFGDSPILPGKPRGRYSVIYTSSGFIVAAFMTLYRPACRNHSLTPHGFHYMMSADYSSQYNHGMNDMFDGDVRTMNISSQVPDDAEQEENAFVMHFLAVQSLGPVEYILNVTMTTLETASPTSDDCRYWRITIKHFSKDNPYSEITMPLFYYDVVDPSVVICKLILDSTGTLIPMPNNFITRHNIVQVSWFSYDRVNPPFNASLTLRTTKCAAAHAYCGATESVTHVHAQDMPDMWRGKLYDTLPMIDTKLTSMMRYCEILTRTGGWVLIPSTRSRLCITRMVSRSGPTLLRNIVLPFVGISCITLQHIPHYSYWRKPQLDCLLSVQFMTLMANDAILDIEQQNFEYGITSAVTAVVERATECRFPYLRQDVRHVNIRYGIEPACVSMTITAAITRYRLQRLPLEYTMANVHEFVLQVKRIRSEHFIHHLKLETPNNFTVVGIKSTQFGGGWFLLKSAYAHDIINLGDFRSTLRNITLLHLVQDGGTKCRHQCVTVSFFYTVPFRERSVKFSTDELLAYQHKVKLCPSGTRKRYQVQFSTYAERHIFLAPIDDTGFNVPKPCPYILRINPFFPIKHVLSAFHHYTDGTCCDADVGRYYVSWRYQHVSWVEAKDRCESVGGHLPTVDTEEELSLLEHVVLGTRFNSGMAPYLSPIRLYPYTGVFLGINIFKVG